MQLNFCCSSIELDKVAQLLIENGANLNITNKRGQTPFDVAIDESKSFNFEPSEVN